jgi:hypothetical protein
MNDKIKYLRIALAIQLIGLKEIDLAKIIETYEAINKKGGLLSLRDIAEIEIAIEREYKPKLELQSKEVNES